MPFRLPRYSWRQLRGDALGGFAASLIALPYGLGMATAMGLPPVLGVYTSILTAPILVLLGRNPVLIGGAASVTVPFVASAFASQGIGGAAKVSIVASIFMMVFSVLRLGRIITMIPLAVVSGFSCGIGALMVISQLPSIFGVKVQSSSAMLLVLVQVVEQLGRAHWQPLLLGSSVILVATLSRRWMPRSPAPLLGVMFAAGIAALFGWKGVRIGDLPVSLPPFVGFSWAPGDVFAVLPEAFALAVVTSVNLLVTSRVVEHFRGRHQLVKKTAADSELGAYSVANLFAGVFGAPMSVGIPARSLANVRCGGTSRMSNLLHAFYLLVFLRIGQGLIGSIPMSALAGVTAWMGFCLLDWGTWHRLPKMRREDALAFFTTALGVLVTNAVAAVAAGCSFYLWRFLSERIQAGYAAPGSTTSSAVK